MNEELKNQGIVDFSHPVFLNPSLRLKVSVPIAIGRGMGS
jgi:hypothetical protein